MAVDFNDITNHIGKKYSNPVMQDVAIPGAGGPVYSTKITMAGKQELGIWVKCAGSAPDIQVAVEFSPTNVDADFSELEGGSVQFANITDINPHNDILIRKPSNWVRIAVTGNAGNGADTTVTIVINHTFQG